MSEGLSVQERIDLGPDAAINVLAVGSLRKLREQMLQEPYYEASKVRSLLQLQEVEPLVTDGTLLAFKDHGDYLFPVFQFGAEDGQPLVTVSRVNMILDAAHDGWGVTGWWTQSNGRLPDAMAPKELLGTPSEYAAIQLAEAMISDE